MPLLISVLYQQWENWTPEQETVNEFERIKGLLVFLVTDLCYYVFLFTNSVSEFN